MSEKNIIDRTATPLTVPSLTEQLRSCGLAEGQTVLVHLAMSKLGWIIGGAQAVILALLAAVGESGTIMMPTNNSSNIDPWEAQNPPIPEEWWQTIRAAAHLAGGGSQRPSGLLIGSTRPKCQLSSGGPRPH